MKFPIFALALFFLLLSLPFPCAAADMTGEADFRPVDSVVARAGSDPITLREVNSLRREAPGLTYDEAVQAFSDSLRLEPDSASTHYTLGTVFLQQGRLDPAIKHLKEAVRLEPGLAGARQNLSIALSRRAKTQ